MRFPASGGALAAAAMAGLLWACAGPQAPEDPSPPAPGDAAEAPPRTGGSTPPRDGPAAWPRATWTPDAVPVGGRYTTFGGEEDAFGRMDLLLGPGGTARLRVDAGGDSAGAPDRVGSWERLEDEIRVRFEGDEEVRRFQVQGDVLFRVDPFIRRVGEGEFVRWSPAARRALVGTWRVERLVTPVERVEAPEPARITFEDAGTYRMVLPCLGATGAWVGGGGRLLLSAPETSVTCEAGAPETARRLVRDLARTRIWWRDGARLRLELPVDGGTFLLREATGTAGDHSASTDSQAP